MRCWSFTAVCFVVTVLTVEVGRAAGNVGSASLMSDEKRLYRYLMQGYERSVRPVINASSVVQIKLGITLTQIFDFDEKNQVVTVNVWLDQEWQDEQLQWDPDEFNGISILRLPCDSIWLPDIVLYNSVEDYTTPYMRALAMVSSDGNVFWPPIVRFRSSCKVDITYFPFDDQICRMKMGSWAYDGFQVDVLNRTSEIDLSNYIDNGEWLLLEILPVRNVVRYACCDTPFPDVTFWLHLRRRTTYYAFNVIIPCAFLSLLTLFSFLLPAASGEKVSLGLTVLLAFSVFMLLIAENMPATSEFVPLIGIYLTVTMAMTSLSIILAVFVLHIHHRGAQEVRAPRWLRHIALNTLARWMCMTVANDAHYAASHHPNCFHQSDFSAPEVCMNGTHAYHHQSFASTLYGGGSVKHARSAERSGKNSAAVTSSHLTAAQQAYTVNTNNRQYQRQTSVTSQQQRSSFKTHDADDVMQSGDASSSLCLQHELLRELRDAAARRHADDWTTRIQREWHDVSAVCDRLMFFIFSAITVCSSVILLFVYPLTKDVNLSEHIARASES